MDGNETWAEAFAGLMCEAREKLLYPLAVAAPLAGTVYLLALLALSLGA